jgi:hypothetical protein
MCARKEHYSCIKGREGRGLFPESVEACRGIARGTLYSPMLRGLLADKQVVVGV